MKFPLPPWLVVLMLCSAAGTRSSAANEVYSDVVGFTTVEAAAKPANIKGFSYISLNMTRPVVYQGLVAASGLSTVNGLTVLTFPQNTFTANQFNGSGVTQYNHYLEVTNGASAGVTSAIASTTDSQIILQDDITATMSVGTTIIKIRPRWTFGTAFGANNSAGFQGGTSASSADVIQILDPAVGILTSYYFSSTANQWRTGFTDATNIPIPEDVGLIVERKQNTPVSFKLTGAVKTGPTALYVQGGGNPSTNIIPNPYPIGSVTLAASTLYTGNVNTGFEGGSSASGADTLSTLDPATGVLKSYFYSTTASQWRSGFTDATNVTIPPGTAVLINRKASRPSFVWYMPQPVIGL